MYSQTFNMLLFIGLLALLRPPTCQLCYTFNQIKHIPNLLNIFEFCFVDSHAKSNAHSSLYN